MDKTSLGNFLINSLSKYGFYNYGSKLFYKEFSDSVVILEQLNYRTCAELYFRLIIKSCHPEMTNITKAVLKDEMIIDTANYPKMLYYTENGYRWDFYDIPETDFSDKVDMLYNNYLKGFEINVIEGIKSYNNFEASMKYPNLLMLWKDSAEKIGYLEVAGIRGHDWLLNDYYIVVYKNGVDSRYVNDGNAKFILENIIAKIPSELKGKAREKWCNEKCKELFVRQGYRKYFGYGLAFPIINGKPLKFCGFEIDKNTYRSDEIYINEDTNEKFKYIRKTVDAKTKKVLEYEIIKL